MDVTILTERDTLQQDVNQQRNRTDSDCNEPLLDSKPIIAINSECFASKSYQNNLQDEDSSNNYQEDRVLGDATENVKLNIN